MDVYERDSIAEERCLELDYQGEMMSGVCRGAGTKCRLVLFDAESTATSRL